MATFSVVDVLDDSPLNTFTGTTLHCTLTCLALVYAQYTVYYASQCNIRVSY